MRVLVTDGDERAALAVVRSLGTAGHRVEVVSPGERSLAGASRYALRDFPAPDPLSEPEAFAAGVSRITDRDGGCEVLIPVSEASLHALLPRRDDFDGVRIPFPGHADFDAVCDKARVYQVARELGVAVPKQVRVEAPEQAVEIGGGLEFPVVVKPSRSVVGSRGKKVKTRVRHVPTAGQLEAVLDEVPPEGYPVLVQERIEGPGTGVFLLVWGGELVACFCHRRIREKPPSGGVSVLRESVPADRSLVESSRELLDRFGWQGVAMVEYKRDRTTGTPYLMEVNGRFWGSLQLAVDAGVDFPRLLVEAASGQSPEPVLEYETGVRTRWLLGDVDHLLARLRRSPAELGLDPQAGGRGRALGAFFMAFGPGSRNEVFRWSDPRPGLREASQWIRDVVSGRGVGAAAPPAGHLETE